MTQLPPKRQKPRMGVKDEVKRVWPRHRKWLRTFQCVCTSCLNIDPIEVHHIRTADNAGTGLKPHDSFAVPMCQHHHELYHRMGHDTFERTYGLDLMKLAIEFTKRSPDKAMRESLALMEVRVPDKATDAALALCVRIRERYKAPGNEHVLELAEAALEIDRFAVHCKTRFGITTPSTVTPQPRRKRND